MFRLAKKEDILAVTHIYDEIHQQEAEGKTTIGWIPKIYPVEETARQAIERNDLFVYEENNKVLAAAIINQSQVDSYYKGKWQYTAADNEVMVLHTLVVSPSAGGKGIGKRFVSFYEQYASKHGCKFLRMDTNAINSRARTLYNKLGYTETDIVPCVFNGIPNVQLVLLEKKL